MTEPVAVDPATLRTLTDRLTAIAEELAAVAIPGVTPAPGSGLGGLAGPRRATADVQRLGAAVRDWAAAEFRPERLAYLSCSAGTLNRDLSALAAAGYTVEALMPYDFFPQTHHVETLALMIQRG